MSTSPETNKTDGGDPFSDKASAAHQLSKDTIYHLLQVQRRRFALRYLQGTTEPVVMRDLAEQVAAWEYGTTIENLQSKERQRTYISLYQSHLPKLDKEGVIEYDQAQGLVTRTDSALQFDPYLKACQTQQTGSGGNESESDTPPSRQWIQWYWSAAMVSCGLLTINTFDLSVGVYLSEQLVLSVIVLLFALITAGYHVSHQR
ncbi:hypothetical protein [Haladaptatus sp. CMAA 1911]|uniref:DUF7344 domain-containing protein n=1 Tax=unclassified Haladaptatus TaxID=2622732 RepID=UPI0037549F90